MDGIGSPSPRDQHDAPRPRAGAGQVRPVLRDQFDPGEARPSPRQVRLRNWPHHEVRACADRQRGLVTHAQLSSLGISRSTIGRALQCGAIKPVFRGVYGVLDLQALPKYAREHAAVLVYQPDAYLSHASAAALWGLLPLPRDTVHVTIVGRHGGCSRAGLTVHRAAHLDRRDHRRLHGLPVTSPAWTLFDLAPALPYRQLEHSFDEALKLGILRRSEVRELLERCPTRSGAKRLRAVADDRRPSAWTRSRTERRLRQLIRKAGLPTPHSNTTFDGIELDLFWPEQRLNVETDGYDFHSAQRDLESDHRRDRRLQARGIVVLRFSARQVWDEPALVVAEIAAALALRRAA